MPEPTQMDFQLLAELPHGIAWLSIFLIPMVGAASLLSAKLATGDRVDRARRRFLTCLVAITLVTVRTVVACDECWLIHMMTVAGMVIGAMALPDQEASLAI